VGAEIRVRSLSAGRSVQAVVTDTDGDNVRVMYTVGGRFCVRTVKKAEYLDMQAEFGEIIERPPDMQGASGENAREAPAAEAETVTPEANREPHAEPEVGDTASITLDGDIQVMPDEDLPRGRQATRELAIGSTVAVRSSSLGRCVEGVVTAVTSDRVRVQYFLNGRCCTKAIARSSLDMQLP